VHDSARATVFVAEATVVAAAAMAKAASNKATEVVRRAPEPHGDPASARPAASSALEPRTARRTHRRVPPLPRRNRSRWEKIRPSDALLSGTGPRFVKPRGPRRRYPTAAAPHCAGI
jgi:hypothetical protein